MQWTQKKKQRALIAALGVILMVGIGLAACHPRPNPPVTPPSTAAVVTHAPATFSARTATPTLARTSTPASPPVTRQTPTPVPSVVYPTSTYIATAETMTPTPRATATMAATATIATTQPPTPAPSPTVTPLQPITGGAPQTTGGIALAQLVAITGGLVLLFGILYRRVGRRK